MKLTVRTYYAVLALASLSDDPLVEDRWRRIEEIAKARGISESFLLQVFQDLKKSGLVHSKRGANGGYALSRSPESIDLAEIIEGVEGPILPSPSEERGGNGNRHPASWRGLDRIWEDIRSEVREVTRGHTLDVIAKRLNAEDSEMYYI